MNKIVVAAAASIVLSMTACKEKGPSINFGGAKAVDSTYTAAVEPQQDRVVLLEEFTGQSCSNCPAGHTLIYGPSGIKEQHPDHVAVIGYHILNFPQSDPVHGVAKFDFRTQKGTDISTSIFGGITQMPCAGIDRQTVGSTMKLDRDLWAGQVNTDAVVKPPVNIHLTSTYDSSARKATIVVTVAYTQAVAKKQNLTLSLIENNIIDAQEDGLNIVNNYTHRSVFRDVFTQFYGDPVLDSLSIKPPGRVYQRTFAINVDPAWNAGNCEVVAFVHDNEGDDKQVLQAAEINLK